MYVRNENLLRRLRLVTVSKRNILVEISDAYLSTRTTLQLHMRGLHATWPSKLFLRSPITRTSRTVTTRYCRVTFTSHVGRHVYYATQRDSNLQLNRNLSFPFSTTSAPASSWSSTMSSSEENFDLDVSDSESEDYAPAPKKTAKGAPKSKAAPAKAASKPAAKPKAATKKKVLIDKDDNASELEEGSDNDVVASERPAVPAKKKTASETYQKVRTLLYWGLRDILDEL